MEQVKVITNNVAETLEIRWDGERYVLRHEGMNYLTHFPYVTVILLNPREKKEVDEFRKGETKSEPQPTREEVRKYMTDLKDKAGH